MKNKIIKIFNNQDALELLKGSGISLFLRFTGLFFGYLLTLLIAYLFGARGLGDYVLAITVLRLFTLFSKLGLDTTSIKYIASFAVKNKWQTILHIRKKIIFILIISSIIFSLLMYLLSEPIASLINAKSNYIRLNAFFIMPMAFFILNYQSLRGLKRIAEFSFFYRVSQALFSIIFIAIIYQFIESSEVPIYAYLLSIFLVSCLSFIVFRYWITYMKKGKNIAREEVISYSTLFKISIPLMFAQSVQFVMAWTDKLMLGAMTTLEDVGIYHTAFKLSMFAAVSLMAVNSIASPKFAELFAKKDLAGLKRITSQSTKIIFWSSLPLVVVFFLFPNYLLGFFGEEFKVGVWAFIILSIGRLISSFSGSVGNLLQMTGNQNIYAKILFSGAVLNICLNLILIPENNPLSFLGIKGINGAAIASMSSLILWNVSMIIAVKNKLGFYTFYIPFIKK